jgi:DNA/RNA-binding protein KIN17
MLVSDQFNSRFWSADGEDDATNPSKKAKKDSNGSANVLAQIMRESEQGKEKVNRKDYWLCEGLVVKVMSRNLADYYKQKGVVQRVIGKYVGEIEMLDSKHVLKVDQEELETVIPQIGGVVRIVNGAYRGSNARLLSIDTANFNAKVRIENGAFDGRTITVDYEDICKLSS